MAGEHVERRLAAIVSADMVGYSRLMSADELGTLEALKRYQAETIDPAITAHHGRIVKLMGDGLLLEFASVVDAVECCIAIQRALAARNADVPAERRIDFRIGINLGDIIIDDADIYGDGVNIAARLQELAETGGIAISRAARDQIRDKLDVTLEDRGEIAVKNIARPVRVFRVLFDDGAPPADGRAESPAPLPPPQAKPTVAVLPLDNMSGDSEQEFFADGMAEDIITELSRFSDINVLARNSTFVYKGQKINVPEVGRQLGADYVVEGSVRKAGNRVRITVQLIDVVSGNHVWAERYDRELDDIFAVQDDVTSRIVAALPARIEAAMVASTRRKPTDNMAAYEYLLRGKDLHHRGGKEDNAQAMRMLERAIELDPDYAQAYAWTACTLGQALARGYLDDPAQAPRRIVETVEKAVALDDDDTECQRILCEIEMVQRDFDRAEIHNQRALALNPNDPRIVAQRSELLTWTGAAEDAVLWIEKAMTLDPHGSDSRAHLLGQALYGADRYAEAVAAFKRIANPRPSQRAFLAAAAAQAGDTDEARAQAAALREADPGFTVEPYVASLPYREDGDRQRLREGLEKAGLS